MKNLLKSVMLMLLMLPFIGCEAEPVDTVNPNQSRFNLESLAELPSGPCENAESFAKFANYGDFETNFIVYDSDGNVLSREFLSPNDFSGAKEINSNEKLTIKIRNSENSFRKTIGVSPCTIYSFVIDSRNNVITNKFEL